MKLLKKANNNQGGVLSSLTHFFPVFSFFTSESLIPPEKLGFLMFYLFKGYKEGTLGRNGLKL